MDEEQFDDFDIDLPEMTDAERAALLYRYLRALLDNPPTPPAR